MIKVANNWKYHKKIILSSLSIHCRFSHKAVEYVLAAKDLNAALCKRLVDGHYTAFSLDTFVLIETVPKCFRDLNSGDFFNICGKSLTYLKINDNLIFNFDEQKTEEVRNPDWAVSSNITFLGVLEHD